jgi:hypothetical protein
MPLGVYASFANSLFVGISKSSENLVTGHRCWRDGERAKRATGSITLTQMMPITKRAIADQATVRLVD